MAFVETGRLRGQRAQYEPVDLATIVYVVAATIAVLLSLRSDGVPGEWWLLLANALLLVLVALAPRARSRGPVGRTLGDWYPMLLLPALYAEVGILTLNAGFQNDWTVQRLETWVFGSEVLPLDPRDAQRAAVVDPARLLPDVRRDPVRLAVRAVGERAARSGSPDHSRAGGDVLPLLHGVSLFPGRRAALRLRSPQQRRRARVARARRAVGPGHGRLLGRGVPLFPRGRRGRGHGDGRALLASPRARVAARYRRAGARCRLRSVPLRRGRLEWSRRRGTDSGGDGVVAGAAAATRRLSRGRARGW